MNRAIEHILACGEPFALVSQQSSDLPEALAGARAASPRGILKCLMSPEHGFFGAAAAGEETANAIHPRWGIPIHSLYGKTRKPTPEMLAGVKRIVFDLQDIGVRCYTYLATLRNVLEAARENGCAVTVIDRPVPVGGPPEGPMIEPEWQSFVGPVNVPLRHGMTPAECALWIAQQISQDLQNPMESTESDHSADSSRFCKSCEIDIVRLENWDHAPRGPWANFMPPSPGIKSWDAAAIYPATVFTEAFPAITCDRAGSYAFRVLAYPGMDAYALAEELSEPLLDCGFTIRPFRLNDADHLLLRLQGEAASRRLEQGEAASRRLKQGEAASSRLKQGEAASRRLCAYRPCEAGLRILAAMLRRNPELAHTARPEWMAKLYGSMKVYDAALSGNIDPLFPAWRTPPFTPVRLY